MLGDMGSPKMSKTNFFPVFGSTCTVGLPRSAGSPVSGSVVSVGLGGSGVIGSKILFSE